MKNKIAEISLVFWIMKIIATTLGETLGDFLSMTLSLGYLSSLITYSDSASKGIIVIVMNALVIWSLSR